MAETRFEHEAGAVLEAAMRDGVSAVVRLTLHRGLRFRPAGSETLLLDADGAIVFWCAYYGAAVLANGWEPFDQPSSTAYMPLPYAAFDRINLDDGGVLLIQTSARRETVRRPVVDDGAARRCEFLNTDDVGQIAERVARWLTGSKRPADGFTSWADRLASRLAPSLALLAAG